MAENNVDGTTETPNENWDISFSREQLLEKSPEELAELVMKASSWVIRYKEKIKELKTQTQEEPQAGLSKAELEAFYSEKKFFESNPDMSEYKEKLSEYTSKGLSWDDARVLVEKQDPSFENRKVTQKMNFTSWDTPDIGSTSYTQEELKNMPQDVYNRTMELVAQKKVKII